VETKALAGQAKELATGAENVNGIAFVGAIVEASSGDAVRKLATECLRSLDGADAAAVVICAVVGGKSSIAIGLSQSLVDGKGLDAGKMIKEKVAPLIKGGGGGQKGLATAGGVETGKLNDVVSAVRETLS
jgi:alanyl-tRNA synthetase